VEAVVVTIRPQEAVLHTVAELVALASQQFSPYLEQQTQEVAAALAVDSQA
jgi:hypothetical protein